MYNFLFSADSICYILWCKSESSSPRFNQEPSEKSESTRPFVLNIDTGKKNSPPIG